jgi:hypothetical protein
MPKPATLPTIAFDGKDDSLDVMSEGRQDEGAGRVCALAADLESLSSFAVNAIRRWWRAMGKKRYPKARRLMISADGGGSNGYRVRLWKVELQKLADELKLPITICHLPPGASKWNKIEHRLFSFITINWRGVLASADQTKGLSINNKLIAAVV